MTESFAYPDFREKCRTTWACIRVVTCGDSESTLNLIIRVVTYDRDESRLLVRAHALKMIKKRRVNGRKNNKVYIARDREWGEAGEKRARGDSQWYLYKDWSAAKIIETSPSSSSFVPAVSSSFIRRLIPTHLSLSPPSIYNIYLSLLPLSLPPESRVLNTRGKVDI